MTGSARMLALLTTAAVALPLGGCGDEEESGKPIPRRTAEHLQKRLDRVDELVAERHCDFVEKPLGDLDASIAALADKGVGSDVRRALADGVARLRDLASRDCQPQEVDEPEVETAPTETTPVETETEIERDDEPTPPPEEETPPVEIPEVEPEEVQPELPDEEQDGGIGPPGQRKKDGD